MMKKFGLELEKDGKYSKLIVITAALLSGTIWAPGVFLGILTAQWKVEYGLGQALARKSSNFCVFTPRWSIPNYFTKVTIFCQNKIFFHV